MLLLCDVPGLGEDDGEVFQGYVQSRVITVEGPDMLGFFREGSLVAKASSGTSIEATALGDFGLTSSQGTVTLTPSGTEDYVVRKFEGLQLADIVYLQVKIGDPTTPTAPVACWSLESFYTPGQPEGEA